MAQKDGNLAGMNSPFGDRSYGGGPAVERIGRCRASLLDVALTDTAEPR